MRPETEPATAPTVILRGPPPMPLAEVPPPPAHYTLRTTHRPDVPLADWHMSRDELLAADPLIRLLCAQGLTPAEACEQAALTLYPR